MNNKENEVRTLEKIAGILEEAGLTLSNQLGVIDILKHALIQSAMNKGETK